MFSYLSDTRISGYIYTKNKKTRSLQADCIHSSGYFVNGGKRAYKTCRLCSDQRGSAAVEASLILPLFILSMLVIVSMCGCVRTRHAIYEGLQETAQYLAEYEYLYHRIGEGIDMDTDESPAGTVINLAAAYEKLRDYIDAPDLIGQYVAGGMNGLIITEADYNPQDGFLYLELRYKLKSGISFFGNQEWDVRERIRQKAYLGYRTAEQSGEQTRYVYITENASVYHTRRSCYHISLSISQVSESDRTAVQNSLTPCAICGKYAADTSALYITEEGEHYHTSLGCSGLKRTVYRVKAEDYQYLPACSHCGG